MASVFVSTLADLLESESATLVGTWETRRRADGASARPNDPELRKRVAVFFQTLVAALRAGSAATSTSSITDLALRDRALTPAVESWSHEYKLLRDLVLDAVDAASLTLTTLEVRVLGDVFAAAIVETASVEAENARQRLLGLVENAPALVFSLGGPNHVYELVNPTYQRFVGADRVLVGRPVAEAVPEAAEQGFVSVLDAVYASGTPFVANEILFRWARDGGTFQELYYNFVCQPRRNAEGRIDGIDVFGFDVDEQVRSRQRIAAMAAEVQEAEAELRLVMDALPVLVSIVTRDEVYGLVNKAYEDWFGVSRELIIGRSVRDLIGDAAYEKLGPFVKRGLAGERFSFEQNGVPYRLGGKRDIRVDFVPRRDLDGTPDGYVALLADVTAQRTLEREREQLAVQRAEVLESMGDAFFALDRDWRILLVNGPFERIVRKDRAELIGRALPEVFPEAMDDPSPFLRAYRRCMADRAPERIVEFYGPLARWLEARIFPSATGIAIFIRDVSSEKKAEQAFQLQAQFEQQLIGIVSHDLRNPLNVIQMASSFLAHGEQLTEGATKNVLRIQNATKRAVRLVNDLLDFTQARLGGGIHLERKPADLRMAITTAIEEIEISFPNRQIDTHLAGDLSGDWDIDRLAQVVQNLVTNAVKYSPDSSSIRIIARADAEGKEVILTVHNEGTPIPAEKLLSIFEPYNRGVSQIDRNTRSVGLGLYIVSEVVTGHGGSVKVSSTAAEGTTFTVVLPQRYAARSL